MLIKLNEANADVVYDRIQGNELIQHASAASCAKGAFGKQGCFKQQPIKCTRTPHAAPPGVQRLAATRLMGGTPAVPALIWYLTTPWVYCCQPPVQISREGHPAAQVGAASLQATGLIECCCTVQNAVALCASSLHCVVRCSGVCMCACSAC